MAYLPLLMLSGDSGRFIYSLPVVLTCSLVASRLVSMTFIPLLGYYLLRPSTRPEWPMAVRRQRGFAGLYYRLGGFALEHRWKVLTSVSLVFLGLGLSCVTRIQTQFFPQDFSYLSYVDVWLPEDAPLSATNEAARRAEEVLQAARPKLARLAQSLPPGYTMEIGGEEEEQVKGFKELAIVMLVSGACIFLALVIQFKNLFKPLIVFAAIPYGLVGALAALALLGSPFGFIAFLGIASLIGVIVSHVIMLFDFIEERHEQGAPLREALLDAGIIRLRPVLITVGATVFSLIPLALHGGPLWEPLCYAQIGGLTLATFITLLLVPVLYAIFVLDLKIVAWETTKEEHGYAEERQGL